MRLLIKDGRVIDVKSGFDAIVDILVNGSHVAKIGKALKIKDAVVIDAKNMLVIPGLIDMHAHFREPGYEYKETILSGSRAAAAGGFTSVCCMPNTNPVADNQEVVEFMLAQNKKAGLIHLFPIGAITKGSLGLQLSDIGDLKTGGAVALSDDGNGLMNAELMRRSMEYASMMGLPIIAHCEDTNLSAGGVMNEGYISTVLGLKGSACIAETTMIARDIEIARFTGARLHIAHVSTKESVELVRRAKAEGLNISCECTPHHFTLTEDAVIGYNTNTKVNPPLRSQEDVDALKRGLQDGTIDCIATDHAPHALAEKDVEFDQAPFGVIGLETALGLCLTELVDSGILTLKQLIGKMSCNPARILNLKKGTLEVGADADIVVIDPKKKWIVDENQFCSKSKNSPFIGMKLKGQAVVTIASGKVIFKAGEQ